MKKLIHEGFYGEGNPIYDRHTMHGISHEIVWKLTSYYGGPEKSGEYYVSNGDGKVHKLYCTSDNQGIELLRGLIEHTYSNIVWYKTNELLTNDELIAMCYAYSIWYDIHGDYSCGEWSGTDTLKIVGWTNGNNIIGSVPKYFLEEDFRGPLDSELEDMEEEIRN